MKEKSTTQLRSQAEARLDALKINGTARYATESEVRRLVHELEVHQIELEMQNDELERVQAELETSRTKYFNLFYLTPVGYFTLTEAGMIVEVNLTAAGLLGFERNELLKKPVTRFIFREDQDIYYQHNRKLSETRAKQVCELRMTGKDGIPFWVHMDGVIAQTSDNALLYRTTISDITDLKQAEDNLKSLLKEKEVLAREVHHRVKNNFAIVSSLLNLQSHEIQDKNVKGMFMQSRDRINSIALLHERLYKSQDLTHINFSEYIRSLATDLCNVYGTDMSRISTVVEVEDIVLDVDKVLLCGLIVNELILNALKYGFPESRTDKGQINVRLHRINENEIELTVSDNGIGLPDDFDIKKTNSLGLKLVTMMAEGQLDGKLKVSGNSGATFQIQFALQPFVN